MVLKTSVALLLLAPLSVLAQDFGSTNLTIKIYPQDPENGFPCPSGGDGGLVITTKTMPREMTCINLEDMFGRGDKQNGFLNDTSSHLVNWDNVDESNLPPFGIHWHIPEESIEFDSSKNWSRLWFEQRKARDVGESLEGEDGHWVITTWANPSCERVNVTETPWYESSCQTGHDGQCEYLGYSIKSIGIRSYPTDEEDECKTWAEVGSPAWALVPQVSAALAAAMACFLFL